MRHFPISAVAGLTCTPAFFLPAPSLSGSSNSHLESGGGYSISSQRLRAARHTPKVTDSETERCESLK